MILALTPRGDYAAETAASWGLRALEGSRFIHHDGEEVTLAILQARTGTATHILYFGHGKRDRWVQCSANGRAILRVVRTIIAVSNAAAFGSAVVFAFACHSSVSLGPAAVRAGVKRYVGFRRVVSWFVGERFERVLALTVHDLVHLTLTKGDDLTESDLIAPIRERQQYFADLSSRGDQDATRLEEVLDRWARALTCTAIENLENSQNFSLFSWILARSRKSFKLPY